MARLFTTAFFWQATRRSTHTSPILLHTHGRRTVVLAARTVREPLYPVDERHVDEAVNWLETNWRGEPFIPKELRPLAA